MTPPLLNDAAIQQLTRLVVEAHLYDAAAKRETFFLESRGFFLTLPQLPSEGDQARSDLARMAQARAQADGKVPLTVWLAAVARQLEALGRASASVVLQHLADVEARLRAESAAAAPVASERPRAIEHDVLVLHAGTEAAAARGLAEGLPGRRLRFEDRALVPRDAEGWRFLEALGRRSRVAAVWLGPAAVGLMRSRQERVARALELLDGLCERVIGVLPDPSPAAVEEARALWPFRALAPAGRLLEALPPPLPPSPMGVPFVIIAPTAAEVEALLEGPVAQLGAARRADLDAVRRAVEASGGDLLRRYGRTRAHWQPFDDGRRVQALLDTRLSHLNQGTRGRSLITQRYPFEPLLRRDAELLPLYDELARSGCVVLLDELALFHPELRRAFLSVPFQHSQNAALITVRPLDANRHPALRPISEAALDALSHAVYRFQTNLDPHCELGVGSSVWFDRWLNAALPDVAASLREPRADPNRLRRFLEDEGLEGAGVDLGRVLYFDSE